MSCQLLGFPCVLSALGIYLIMSLSLDHIMDVSATKCMFNYFGPVLSFRCAIQSGCAPPESGWMNTAGKREWHYVKGGDGSRTAAREKIDPEEVTICTGHMRGANLCFIDFKINF